jgi:hypothetical protein
VPRCGQPITTTLLSFTVPLRFTTLSETTPSQLMTAIRPITASSSTLEAPHTLLVKALMASKSLLSIQTKVLLEVPTNLSSLVRLILAQTSQSLLAAILLLLHLLAISPCKWIKDSHEFSSRLITLTAPVYAEPRNRPQARRAQIPLAGRNLMASRQTSMGQHWRLLFFWVLPPGCCKSVERLGYYNLRMPWTR